VTALALGRGALLFERNLMVYRRTWLIIFSGFFEPVFYLVSMGIGLGHYVGKVPVDGAGLVSYASFIAPALLASAATNGAIYESTNIFFKLKYAKTYDAILATPLAPRDIAVGETSWTLFRALLYGAGFLAVAAALGLLHSPWAVLALPTVLLIGFGFAGVGIAAATYMRSWQDFEILGLVQLPMFLFSATFYPLSVYPDALQWVVRATPLYHAIALMRGLMLGSVGGEQLVNVAYLGLMGLFGVWIAGRRVYKLLLK
jgi:lipooligosaccharide transport system permease protein